MEKVGRKGKIHHNTIIQDAQIFLGRWKVEDGPINATNMQKRNPYVQSAAVPALRREMMGELIVGEGFVEIYSGLLTEGSAGLCGRECNKCIYGKFKSSTPAFLCWSHNVQKMISSIILENK